MHILMIGAGAVGIGMAASLLEGGAQVDFLELSPETRRALKERGLGREGALQNLSFGPERFRVFGEAGEVEGPYDFVMVSTKSAANPSVAETLDGHRAWLGQGGKILLCQNGWGNDRAYRPYFAPEQLFSARILTGFSKPEPHVSRISVHASPLALGNLKKTDVSCLAPLAELLTEGGLPAEVTEDVEAALWAKMLYNCSLNPLGAILRVSYGELMDSEHARRILDRVLEEIFATMEAAGYHTLWPNVEAYREEFYGKLVPETRSHRSSTYQDLEARRRTEIDTLNGSVVQLAREHGVPVPFNEMLVELVHSIEDQF